MSTARPLGFTHRVEPGGTGVTLITSANTLPRGLTDLYRRTAYTATDPDGGWAYDTLREWVDVTNAVFDGLAQSLNAVTFSGNAAVDNAMRVFEHNEAQKA